MLRITLAVLHLLALGVGVGAISLRARALGMVGTRNDALQDAFHADSKWGLAALLWISTGLWRWLGGMEKATSYYSTNHVFYAKMGFLVLILALEIWPMVTLIRWRVASAKRTLPAAELLAGTARRIAMISRIQLLLVIGMVIAAVMMARGYGA